MISKILLNKKKEIQGGRHGKERGICLFLRYGEGIFFCKYNDRQREEARLNTVSRLNPTLRGGVEGKKGDKDPECQPEPIDWCTQNDRVI